MIVWENTEATTWEREEGVMKLAAEWCRSTSCLRDSAGSRPLGRSGLTDWRRAEVDNDRRDERAKDDMTKSWKEIIFFRPYELLYACCDGDFNNLEASK